MVLHCAASALRLQVAAFRRAVDDLCAVRAGIDWSAHVAVGARYDS